MNNQEIIKLEQKYHVIITSDFNEVYLKFLEEKYLPRRITPARVPQKNIQKVTEVRKPAVTEAKKPSVPEGVVIPDKKYVMSLLNEAAGIKAAGAAFELESYRKGIRNLLADGDFDDPEEIMSAVHNLIEKYIYGSDTKVSVKEWAQLEKYITGAGYVPVDIKAGDDVKNFRKYFKRPIAAPGGASGTIKMIQLKPFTLKYYDGEEVKDDLKLCGKCTYYK